MLSPAQKAWATRKANALLGAPKPAAIALLACIAAVVGYCLQQAFDEFQADSERM